MQPVGFSAPAYFIGFSEMAEEERTPDDLTTTCRWPPRWDRFLALAASGTASNEAGIYFGNLGK
jgi:hypothetical protein